MRALPLLIAAAAVLAACSQPEPQPAPAPAPAEPPVAEPAPLTTVPVRWQGEWNASVAACGGAVEETTLIIGADRIAFYESAGAITAVSEPQADRLSLTARVTGEGETRDQTYGFSLSADGNSLTMTEPAGTGMTRQRCPA